jgi:hypothetical protein
MKSRSLALSIALTSVFFLGAKLGPVEEETNVRMDWAIYQDSTFYNDGVRFEFLALDPARSFHMCNQPGPLFWRRVLDLGRDSSIAVDIVTRQTYGVISARLIDSMERMGRLDSFAKAFRMQLGFDSLAPIRFVSGKSQFFQYQKVGPLLHLAFEEFTKLGVDPRIAELLLLIESPNNPNGVSSSGAVGHFQLMPFVAKKYGLVVNSSRDERLDFSRSAYAAARLVNEYAMPAADEICRSIGLEPQPKELWYHLLVLHIYNAGGASVSQAASVIGQVEDPYEFIQALWKTKAGRFGNQSQNYSQVALASYCKYRDFLFQRK